MAESSDIGKTKNDERRQGASGAAGPTGTEPVPAPKPSQAEGDRETVEQGLREKESSGEI